MLSLGNLFESSVNSSLAGLELTMMTSGIQEETRQGEKLADSPAPKLPPVLSSEMNLSEKGDVVEILPWEDLIHKLDRNGTTGGLPFMPEMVKYCGQQLTV